MLLVLPDRIGGLALGLRQLGIRIRLKVFGKSLQDRHGPSSQQPSNRFQLKIRTRLTNFKQRYQRLGKISAQVLQYFRYFISLQMNGNSAYHCS